MSQLAIFYKVHANTKEKIRSLFFNMMLQCLKGLGFKWEYLKVLLQCIIITPHHTVLWNRQAPAAHYVGQGTGKPIRVS